MVNDCPLCSANEDTVDHLLLNCRVAQVLWRSILSWFKYRWVLRRSIRDLVEAWHLQSLSIRGRVMWTSFLRFCGFFGKREILVASIETTN